MVVLLTAVACAAAALLLTDEVRRYVPALRPHSRAHSRADAVRSPQAPTPQAPTPQAPTPQAPTAQFLPATRWPRPLAWAHVVLAATGGVGAAAVADGAAELVALAAAAVGCAMLAVVDLAEKRLPDRLVAGTLVAVLVPLTVAAATGAGWGTLGRALLGAVVLLVGYLALALAAPSGLGLGDVKFAAVVGALLGWFGWQHVAAGTLLAFALNAVVALVVLVSRRGGRDSDIPFGPAMILGAVLAVALLG